MGMTPDSIETECHPWEPFIPDGAKVLILGTFPPQRKRWSMDFYYPNRTNNFWPIMGHIFFGDREALYAPGRKQFDLAAIKRLLTDKGIALHDTARKIRRLQGNASDKFLEIVEPLPLHELLAQMPGCHTIATTGEKAAGVIAGLTHTAVPRMGEMTVADNGLEIWRMPSTSRAYPLPLTEKAARYAALFRRLGML